MQISHFDRCSHDLQHALAPLCYALLERSQAHSAPLESYLSRVGPEKRWVGPAGPRRPARICLAFSWLPSLLPQYETRPPLPRLHDFSATLLQPAWRVQAQNPCLRCLHQSPCSRPAKAIASPESRFTLLFPIRWMCYKRPSEGCPDMAHKQAVLPLPGDLATLAGPPPQAASTANAKPVADAYREVQHSELPSAFCPRCSARLEPRSCKLICSCGYYMSCSDFY
jgi:hypothetical protein